MGGKNSFLCVEKVWEQDLGGSLASQTLHMRVWAVRLGGWGTKVKGDSDRDSEPDCKWQSFMSGCLGTKYVRVKLLTLRKCHC